MTDEKRARKIRAELSAIAPFPEAGDVTPATLARHFAVAAQERWARQIGYPGDSIDPQQLSLMTAEFAAAHALFAVAEGGCDPEAVAEEIRDAIGDGSGVGEWLWDHLGDETASKVSRLATELMAALAAPEPAEVPGA